VVLSELMRANSLQIDLPPEERPSLIPWIIILVCVAILLVLLSQLASRIPQSLQQQAQSLLDKRQYPDIELTANGRDIQITGRIATGTPIAPLINQLEQINGVRQVNDELRVYDPMLVAEASQALFGEKLAAVDTGSVAFQPGSINFTPGSNSALSQLLSLLKEHPGSRVRIEGHTDNTGPDTVNLRVSRDRASAVANYLMARGIPSERLVVAAYGSTQPIANNETESGRSQNRRIEIVPVN